MKTAEIGGGTFQIRKVPAYPDQPLLAKAFSPLVAELLPVIFKMLGAQDDPAKREEALKGKFQITPEALAEILDGAFTAVQKLSEDDLLNLTRRSLAAVQVKQGDAGWANVMAGDKIMYDWLDLRMILELMFQVFEVNLLGFLFGGRGTSPAVPPTA